MAIASLDTLDDTALDTPPAEPAADPPAAPATLRDSLAAAYDASAEGKPLPKEGPSVSRAKGVVPGATPVGTPGAPEGAPTGAVPGAEPAERPIPERLKGKIEAQWAALPKEVRGQFHEYESAIGRMADKYGKAAQNWSNVEKTVSPYMEMIRAEGGNVHGAIANLFETARLLRQGSPEQKQGLLIQMAKAYGIPIPGAALEGQQPQPGAVSPELINRLNYLERAVLTREAESVHNVQAQVGSDIEAFVADPANIYVKEPGFLDTMAQLIDNGRAANLADAYKQAAWLHDGTREQEIGKAITARNAPRINQAQRARAAAVSVNGNAPGTVRLDPSKLSLRDTLAAAYDGELE